MTITLLAPDGVAVTAQQERQARAAGHGGGSGRQLGGRSGFRVGTPDTILTATSTTWTLGPCSLMLDPGASTHQGMYGWATDANVTGTVTAAHDTNPRKDIVYIQVNDSTAGDGSGEVTYAPKYAAGNPAVTPSAPALPARSFLLGTITVPAAGGGSPTVVRNPAVYVSAGAPLPVFTVAERDALVKYDGLSVMRMDVAGRQVETWNGTRWTSGPLGTAYVPIWTGVADFGTGGSLTGTYWVDGDRVHVRSKARFGAAASLGTTNNVVRCPLPPGYPIAGTETMHLGTGTYVPASGSIRHLAVFADAGVASVWVASDPVKTPFDAALSAAQNSYFEIAFSYQTSAV